MAGPKIGAVQLDDSDSVPGVRSRGLLVAKAEYDPGHNPTLDLTEVTGQGAYVSGSAVTTGVDINLGNPGKAGDKLKGIAIYNNSGSAFTACVIYDGTTLIDWLTLGMTTLASGSYATWTPPGGVLESKNGGWKLRITCAGTMANIKYGAIVEE